MKLVAEELDTIGSADATFVPIDDQFEFPSELTFHRVEDAACRCFRSYEDQEVVGVTNKAETPLLKNLIEIVQQDVRQQG